MHYTPISRTEHIEAKSANCASAIIEAAKKEVNRAYEAEYRLDPMFRAEFSKVVSFATALTKRHGRLIEFAAAEALKQGGLTVLRNIRAPVNSEALGLVTSDKYSQIVGQQIEFNSNTVVEFIDADLVVIDESNRWGAALSVKRGGGLTETRKRKDGARLMRALNFTLASWLRRQGYRVDIAATAVVDYYGQAGFPADMTLKREGLDAFFGLPVVQTIEATTLAMHEAADAMMGSLLEPVFKAMAPASAREVETRTGITVEPVPASMIRPRVARDLANATTARGAATVAPRH